MCYFHATTLNSFPMQKATIHKALGAYAKVKPTTEAVAAFQEQLATLLERINPDEHEEHNKNLLRDFLKGCDFEPQHLINTKGRADLVIHQGKAATSPVAVLIEAKRPEKSTEMPTRDRLNSKALQELVLYYLRERHDAQSPNTAIRHLIVTDTQQWYLFDAQAFERCFARDKALVRQFKDFEAGRLPSRQTDFFYREIASPAIEAAHDLLDPVFVDLRDYAKAAHKTGDRAALKRLIPLYKLLSPAFLLKLPFANDSNSLDKGFYNELLHLIGLQEVGKSNKTIQRLPAAQRHAGSLLENTIIQLESSNRLSRLPNRLQYGKTEAQQLESVALELVITWVNRILFLKLLEAQLLSYHEADPQYAFLNQQRLPDYDELNTLFFQVLAKRPTDRAAHIQAVFGRVPYLNSSLFEPTELEETTLFINSLRDSLTLPHHGSTVLRDGQGKRLAGQPLTLHYFLDFLEAYDFASEGSEDLQDQPKTIINASVLGLIFEKINGYKDGSFYTPGFITMYMSRETIRRAVVQRFNDTYGWSCRRFSDLREDLSEWIRQHPEGRSPARLSANAAFNQLRVCDPAVGSGHFLVSALNELLAIKHELGILADEKGERLLDIAVTVENDELQVIDLERETLFQYRTQQAASQRVQRTLFHEKQRLIENCLFGVDINPNSVKICRLRLWIELLKNAYYKADDALETLPNIDINIKCGNSLIARYDIHADLSQVLKKHKSRWNIDQYRNAVAAYRTAQSKDEKREMLAFINTVKADFRSSIFHNDPKFKELSKLQGQRLLLQNRAEIGDLFEKLSDTDIETDLQKLDAKIAKLEADIEAIKNNKVFENAFEWRFEFPEVLDDQGQFVGFDVVIGNPPYIRQEAFKALKPYLQAHYATYAGTADLLVYFIERGLNITRQGGFFTYIIANKFMRARFGGALREWLMQYNLVEILDFGDLPVFEEATTYPCILSLSRQQPTDTFRAATLTELPESDFADYIDAIAAPSLQAYLTPDSWNLADEASQRLLAKLQSQGTPLGEYVEDKIHYGIKTGYNKAFVIDAATRAALIAQDPRSAEVIKPFLAGRDIKRYQQPEAPAHLVLFPKGWTKAAFGDLSEAAAFDALAHRYPAIASHLAPHREPAQQRHDQGDYWWELRACDYYEEFEKPKIIFPDISLHGDFTIDLNGGSYLANTGYMIISEKLELLGLLCSKLIHFFNRNIASTYRGGYLRYFSQYIQTIPIKYDMEIWSEIESLVAAVLAQRRADAAADTRALESRIDSLVYALYGLTPSEIAVVEGV